MFSWIILLLPAWSTHYRQRSGSLESQSQFLTESEPSEPVFTISSPRRSNSTEILDDGSSYTSQSSVEYSAPGCHSRAKNRHRRRQGNIYANTGSMPNLAQNDTRGYTSQPRQQPTTTAYYVTGYPRYMEPEVYPNGPYVYETEMEGHYNVNPSYPRHDPHGNYGHDEIDGLAHNLYATLRPPRNRPPSRNENFARHMQRAEVVEHLRGWYSRQNKQQGYDTYRGPQQNLGYRTMSSSYVRSDSTASYSTGEKCCLKKPPVSLCYKYFWASTGVLNWWISRKYFTPTWKELCIRQKKPILGPLRWFSLWPYCQGNWAQFISNVIKYSLTV